MRVSGRDERFRKIDIHATALSSLAVITAVIIGAAVELARGNSGAPFTWLGAIGRDRISDRGRRPEARG